MMTSFSSLEGIGLNSRVACRTIFDLEKDSRNQMKLEKTTCKERTMQRSASQVKAQGVESAFT